jgi:DEAD/DEAH box helicase domain-containing protein
MRDPTGALETFPDNFLLYIRTAFGTQFPGFERERLRLLQEAGVFGQEPSPGSSLCRATSLQGRQSTS